jgi:MobC-like protein
MIMKQKEKAVYTRRVSIRLKETEFDKLEAEFKKTTCRKFSEYLRNIMLAKPITIRYRNASADAFLTEMIGLKKELSSIGNNFNQMVKRLHVLSDCQEVKTWAFFNENSKQILLEKVEDIRRKTNQIYEQWSQE